MKKQSLRLWAKSLLIISIAILLGGITYFISSNYFSPQLLNIMEINQSSQLNGQFGIINSCGVYPNRNAQRDYLQYSAKQILLLGFSDIELIMIPRSLCSSDDLHPNGCYSQANQYCNNGKLKIADMQHMFSLPQFKEVMQMPFQNFALYVEPVKTMSIKQASIHLKSGNYTQGEIQSTHNEVKDAVKYLLTEFKNTGKTFYIYPINELDNRLVQSSGCLASDNDIYTCDDVEVPNYSVNHAINLLNTYAKAIKEAKTEIPEQGVKIYLACEANRVISRSLRGRISAVNDVFPKANCDVFTYSAYETFNRPGTTPDQASNSMKTALDHIAKNTQDHPDFPNDKNILISEIGYPDLISGGKYPITSSTYYNIPIQSFEAAVKAALDWGVSKINFFTIFDQKCILTANQEVKNGDCVGFGIIRPDGTNNTTYNLIKSISSETNNPINASYPNAKFIKQNVPNQMKAGQEYAVELIFANTGSESWYNPGSWLQNDGFYLIDKANKSTDKIWGKALYNIAENQVVNSGEWYNFKITVKAPKKPGDLEYRVK